MATSSPLDHEIRRPSSGEKAPFSIGLDLPQAGAASTSPRISPSNIRQIEGHVKKPLAYKELDNASMDPDTVMWAARDLIRNS